eukprot:TRINITY_DN10334_c0_g1_i6.p2 TRINITY_DN10334_c0_g1~~TRINITY_DN10334_c0_g1_i6.p2  ORF type:complete len:309 (-),score=44.61 TRINITY_DN10334_c0_g1_i6:282-1208(-)
MLYVFGGCSGRQSLDTVESLDLSRLIEAPPAWEREESIRLPAPRFGCAVCSIGAKVFVVGGYDPEAGHLDSVLTLDFGASPEPQWAEIALMRIPRAECSAVNLDGRLVVLGGNSAEGIEVSWCESYCEASDAWHPLRSMNFSRAGAAVCSAWVSNGERESGVDKEIAEIADSFALSPEGLAQDIQERRMRDRRTTSSPRSWAKTEKAITALVRNGTYNRSSRRTTGERELLARNRDWFAFGQVLSSESVPPDYTDDCGPTSYPSISTSKLQPSLPLYSASRSERRKTWQAWQTDQQHGTQANCTKGDL